MCMLIIAIDPCFKLSIHTIKDRDGQPPLFLQLDNHNFFFLIFSRIKILDLNFGIKQNISLKQVVVHGNYLYV